MIDVNNEIIKNMISLEENHRICTEVLAFDNYYIVIGISKEDAI